MTQQDPFSSTGQSDPDATGVLYTQNYGTGGSSSVGSDSGSIGDTAGQTAQDVKDKVADTAYRVREQAASQIDSQKEKATGTLDSVAQAIRQTGTQLRQQDQAPIADYADRAADQIEKLSGYLQNRDVGQIMTEVERLARRQPALFLGGAFFLGILGARFLKSSSEQARAAQGYDDSNYGGYSQGYGSSYSTGYSGRYSGGTTGGYSSSGGTTTGSRTSYGGQSYGSSGGGTGYSGSSSYSASTETDGGSVPPVTARYTSETGGASGTETGAR